MCAVCGSAPCNSRCPNAQEEKPVHICRVCGDGIYKGDKYFQEGYACVCKLCIDEMTTEEILELFNEKLQIA